MKRHVIPLLIVFAVLVVAAYFVVRDEPAPVERSTAGPLDSGNYVGAQRCARCHQAENALWQGSHHQQAMQHASELTVLGDFGDRRVRYHGVESTFFLRDGRYFVRTDGDDGALHEYEVQYTFGVTPLQQYLVATGGGRLQALPLAWDSRPARQGGQRWFHLYPNEKIDHTDELHWTRLSQNWNYMCAECHSTNLEKNFDLASKQFDTQWSDINVACEACHGPGERHIAWADRVPGWRDLPDQGLAVVFDERRDVAWQFAGADNIATRSEPRQTAKEIEVCARCHARRSMQSERYRHGQPLLDTHVPALLTDGLYHADGQIRDEVYVYGSFLQSRMFQQGVSCGDCHEPHSLRLRAPGNQVCLQCHRANYYDTRQHHHHPAQSDGAACVACHMPAKNFMVIDARRDHSFRIPRPDLSAEIGVPNACNQCHSDKTPRWAVDRLQSWYGSDRTRGWHFGLTLSAAREGHPRAGRELAAMTTSSKLPDIVRATAAVSLAAYPGEANEALLHRLLSDPAPVVRRAALQVVDTLEPQRRWQLASRLLSDPLLTVRIEAARVLAPVNREGLSAEHIRLLDAVIAQYVQSQLANSEHPQSHVNLGLLQSRLGRVAEAEASYRQAIELDPAYSAAYVNLSDLYRARDMEQQVEQTLRQALRNDPTSGAAAHALGLHYVRSGQSAEALRLLQQAVRLAPQDARFAYVYGVALHDAGSARQAIATLQQAQQSHPYDVNILIALISYAGEAGEADVARRYAVQLTGIEPRFGSVEDVLRRFAESG